MDKNRNKANTSRTEIMIIADRSGSMKDIIEEARNSINSLIEEQKMVEGDANFTFCMFDHNYERLIDRKDLNDIKPIGKEYHARGMTALLDSVGKSITYLEDQLKKENVKPDNVIIMIVTDGKENDSQEFKKEQIAEMVKTKKEEGWKFMFLGANIDAFAEGGRMGFTPDDTIQYKATEKGVRCAYASASTTISDIRNVKLKK